MKKKFLYITENKDVKAIDLIKRYKIICLIIIINWFNNISETLHLTNHMNDHQSHIENVSKKDTYKKKVRLDKVNLKEKKWRRLFFFMR